MRITHFVLLIGLVALAACRKTKNPESPRITYVNFRPDSVDAGSSDDTAFLAFTFIDGDGDLGVTPGGGVYDIYLKDSRNDSISGFYFPDIDPTIVDPKLGLEGNCLLAMSAAAIIPRPDSVHMKEGDTLQYEVYIRDRAGNESNRFTTPKLYIRP